MTTGSAARGAAPLSGLLLLAAVLCGLFAMHGVQPSPGPVAAPSVLTVDPGHAVGAAMPMASGDGHGDGRSLPHDGHGGGQVCLALLLAGSALLLLLVVTAAGFAVPSARPFLRAFLPRGPTARPRGPTLARLCVIRV
ncbi:hypothetical protein JOL79_20220 [Microbispora sp. RL4-1S]|uniref:Uncharacterized protein n=1 Tax=Microbispora oryzae TaxID=2806554 RepID=A0A941ARI4_9ACTN|nr:DUF6153 family protein [Microbispora oryzae]MBP2706139.1 hypothetical protein [Microbispora oryzae]